MHGPGDGEVRMVEVDGDRLAVWEWGGAGGRPLLFWHALGVATSGGYLDEIAPALVAAGMRPLSFDAPGFGRSPALPPDRYEVASLVRLAVGLLDRLAPGEEAVLAGHSWGGVVMSHVAAAAPERAAGLVLLDSGHLDYQDAPGFDPDVSLEELEAQARSAERTLSLPSWEAVVDDTRADVRRPVVEAVLRIVRAGVVRREGSWEGRTAPAAYAAAMYGLRETRVSDAWPAIAEAGLPVLLLTATEPPEQAAANRAAAEHYARQVPSALVRPVPGAGHDLLLDAGPAVADEMGAWLAGRRASAP